MKCSGGQRVGASLWGDPHSRWDSSVAVLQPAESLSYSALEECTSEFCLASIRGRTASQKEARVTVPGSSVLASGCCRSVALVLIVLSCVQGEVCARSSAAVGSAPRREGRGRSGSARRTSVCAGQHCTWPGSLCRAGLPMSAAWPLTGCLLAGDLGRGTLLFLAFSALLGRIFPVSQRDATWLAAGQGAWG